MKNQQTLPPRLQAPGAGLPLLELWIARILSRINRLTGNREAFTQKFLEERQKIDRLIKDGSPATQSRQVLIQRLPGLEDSSRFWSIFMTLDHLRIVNGEIANIIHMLDRGQVPPRVASTADVKPSQNVSDAVVELYQKSCDQVLSIAQSVSNLKTTTVYAHPWFGPMNAQGWYGLAGVHLGIHRAQIERILLVMM